MPRAVTTSAHRFALPHPFISETVIAVHGQTARYVVAARSYANYLVVRTVRTPAGQDWRPAVFKQVQGSTCASSGRPKSPESGALIDLERADAVREAATHSWTAGVPSMLRGWHGNCSMSRRDSTPCFAASHNS
jgi:hypothetical protein